jgi:hypothetical protein
MTSGFPFFIDRHARIIKTDMNHSQYMTIGHVFYPIASLDVKKNKEAAYTLSQIHR